MEARLNYFKLAPELAKALNAVSQATEASGLEKSLLEIVKLRASQINGCAFCIDMHWKDARHAGESEQRLYGLDAWEESPYYTPRERVALAWAEALTLISKTHAPDKTYEALREHFSDAEIVKLTFAIATINTWNRIAIAMRSVPGHYSPPK